MTKFDLKLLDIHWLGDDKEHTDLCAHGQVFVRIGEEILSDKIKQGDWALNSSSLHLLRSLSEDHFLSGDDYTNDADWALVMCCGHMFWDAKSEGRIRFYKCQDSIDWTVEHIDDNTVKLTTENGTSVTLPIEEYSRPVLKFADQVKEFYDTQPPRAIRDDDDWVYYELNKDRNGYELFWKEWNKLRNSYK